MEDVGTVEDEVQHERQTDTKQRKQKETEQTNPTQTKNKQTKTREQEQRRKGIENGSNENDTRLATINYGHRVAHASPNRRLVWGTVTVADLLCVWLMLDSSGSACVSVLSVSISIGEFCLCILFWI